MSSPLSLSSSFNDLLSQIGPELSIHRHQAEAEQYATSGQLKELKNLIVHSKINAKTWRQPDTGKGLLHIAAESGQVEIIGYLAGEAKVNINGQDSEGNTPLHLAVTSGHAEAVGSLLAHRASDRVCNHDGYPPLHVAIKLGTSGIPVLTEFVKHPVVDVFVQGHFYQTTLHTIAVTNNIEALKIIYDKAHTGQLGSIGSKIIWRNKNGLTVLHLAARVGSHEVLDFLLSKSEDYSLHSKELLCNLSKENRSPLHYAVERAHIECIRILLKFGADPSTSKGFHPPPLHLACSQGNVEAVELMVEACGKDILQSRDQDEGTTLHSSTSSISSNQLISYLVKNGVGLDDVDVNGFSPLMNAIQLGNIAAVETLLVLGANSLISDKWGNNSLHRAVMRKRMEIFKIMISCSSSTALASSADHRGQYPIHLALKMGEAEMVLPLLERAPKMFPDREGSNYMHLAAMSGSERSLEYILATPYAKRMINEPNSDGLTPLHFAAMGSCISAVQKLIDHGAVIHRSNTGQTPFMCACAKGNLEVVQFLYSNNKFQRDWVDHCGCTALHAAVDGGNHQLITFCLDEGMAITLNERRLSFLDMILDRGSRKLAKAALSHKRWAECVDTHSPDKPHPILRIVDTMPEIYTIVLDNCFTKSSLDPSNHDYWEEFNYKCVDLHVTESEQPDSDAEEKGDQGLELADLNQAEEYDAVHTQLHTESHVAEDDVRTLQHRFQTAITRQQRTVSSWWKKKRQYDSTLRVVRKLIENRHESCLLHPVIMSYIKMKWEGFGLYVHFVHLFFHFLLALFFSIFIVAIPLPAQNPDSASNVSMELDSNGMELDSNSMEQSLASLNTGQAVLLFISLVMAAIGLVFFIREVYSQDFRLIVNFTTQFDVWSNLIACVCIIVFLISILVGGVGGALWNAGAIGVFFVWATCTFSLQFLGALNMGVYILMIMSTTRLILKVLIIFLVFIFAFTFSLYVLVGSIAELQYNTVGLSLFTNLHSMIAVTDYLGFARLEQANQIHFSVLVFILLVALVIMLPIVFVNVLIGLAVGDIAKIQRDAVITRLSVEVRALATLNARFIPQCWRKHITKKSQKRYPNQSQHISYLTNFFHRNFDRPSSTEDDRDVQLRDLREELATEREFYRRSLDLLHDKLKMMAEDQSRRMDKLEGMVARETDN